MCLATFELEEVITGVADQETQAEVQSHLEECGRCQRVEYRLREMLIAAGGSEMPSPEVAALSSTMLEMESMLMRAGCKKEIGNWPTRLI